MQLAGLHICTQISNGMHLVAVLLGSASTRLRRRRWGSDTLSVSVLPAVNDQEDVQPRLGYSFGLLVRP